MQIVVRFSREIPLDKYFEKMIGGFEESQINMRPK